MLVLCVVRGCQALTAPHVRSERGAWYALDLGGTNFRVLRLMLSDVAGSIAGVEVRRALASLRTRADASRSASLHIPACVTSFLV